MSTMNEVRESMKKRIHFLSERIKKEAEEHARLREMLASLMEMDSDEEEVASVPSNTLPSKVGRPPKAGKVGRPPKTGASLGSKEDRGPKLDDIVMLALGKSNLTNKELLESVVNLGWKTESANPTTLINQAVWRLSKNKQICRGADRRLQLVKSNKSTKSKMDMSLASAIED